MYTYICIWLYLYSPVIYVYISGCSGNIIRIVTQPRFANARITVILSTIIRPVLTVHFQLPSVLDTGIRQLRILGTTHQKLPLVLHRRRELQTHAVLQLRIAVIRLCSSLGILIYQKFQQEACFAPFKRISTRLKFLIILFTFIAIG